MKTESSNPRILIIGAGSIGERHIRNLLAADYKDIYVFRQRNLPLRTIEPEQIHIFTDFDEIKRIQPEVAFICSPTSMHLEQTMACVEHGMHVFVEKPLSHTIEGLNALKNLVKEKGKYVHIGYMMRFHPLFRRLKNIIQDQQYGKVLSFTSHWGEYLPAWHPWEDYRSSYVARKDLGGGVALTLSHDIDLVNWLMGEELLSFKSLKIQPSRLEVETESVADFLFQYKGGASGHVHLNYIEKVPSRYLKMVFEDASVEVDYFKNAMQVRTKTEEVQHTLTAFERNQLFIDQQAFFMQKIEDYHIEDSIKQIEESELIINICNA